jgi:hypothetical protein
VEPQELVVLYHHDLFADGIVHILSDQGFCPVAIDARDPDALTRLETLRPRVVVLQDNDSGPVFAGKLATILQRAADVGIVRVQAQSNTLEIYCARQVMAGGPGDLLAAISRLAKQPRSQDQEAPATSQ